MHLHILCKHKLLFWMRLIIRQPYKKHKTFESYDLFLWCIFKNKCSSKTYSYKQENQ